VAKKQRAVPLMLRLPAELHRQLSKDAEKAGQSLNSEIVRRLEAPYRESSLDTIIQATADRAATGAAEITIATLFQQPGGIRAKSLSDLANKRFREANPELLARIQRKPESES
jgi:Arc-like DNA binding domain